MEKRKPFTSSAPPRGEDADSDAEGHAVSTLEENPERMRRLYPKLCREVEKIKKWRLSLSSAPKPGAKKVEENGKIIETLQKAVQGLQVRPGPDGAADGAAAACGSGGEGPGPGLRAPAPGGGAWEAADR